MHRLHIHGCLETIPSLQEVVGCSLLSILASGNSWKRLIVCMRHLSVNSSRQLVRAALHVWRHLMENGPAEAWRWLRSKNSKPLL
ncbi:hypothetical protein E2C01_086784 [Portunus trituberculatus]|uniref:Uncharacterized protein n=1 Tax=Portunus trituberculatus TaxID=210409 RepID=A0A5B7JFK6_PORTR|nr:hypothetical protein [Portunus trituberculatus]